jgi:hypothetical protein
MLLETSLNDLYRTSVEAFPKTAMRQNATDTVVVDHLEWVPFQGVGTLFVKATVKNEGRKNEAIILFKGVRYKEGRGRGVVPVSTNSGKTVFLEALSSKKTDVNVRCSCKDFQFRFNYYDHLDRSLFGRKRAKYEGIGLWLANPSELPGMCKHLMKMTKALSESGVLY